MRVISWILSSKTAIILKFKPFKILNRFTCPHLPLNYLTCTALQPQNRTVPWHILHRYTFPKSLLFQRLTSKRVHNTSGPFASWDFIKTVPRSGYRVPTVHSSVSKLHWHHLTLYTFQNVPPLSLCWDISEVCTMGVMELGRAWRSMGLGATKPPFLWTSTLIEVRILGG